ncbi:MAG: hypothetical protein WCJ84_00685 [Candidatus Peregrinibacteria bacterium]
MKSSLLLIFGVFLFSGCSIGENPDQQQFEAQHQDALDTAGEEALLKKARLENREAQVGKKEESPIPIVSPLASPGLEKIPAGELGGKTGLKPVSPDGNIGLKTASTFQIQGENNGYQCTVTCKIPEETPGAKPQKAL